MNALSTLSEQKLAERIRKLIRIEDRAVVELVFCFAELHRRRAHLAQGYDSLFTYCQSLGMSRSKAWRRSAAAELVGMYPLVAELVRSKRLSVSALVALKKVLTRENHVEVLNQAVGMTEDEAAVLASRLSPVPRRTDAISMVHSLRTVTPPRTSAPSEFIHPGGREAAPLETQLVIEETHVVRVTLSKDEREQLLAVKAALSHRIPDGNLHDVFVECLRLTLGVCERRKIGAPPPPQREAPPAAAAAAAAAAPETAAACNPGPKPEIELAKPIAGPAAKAQPTGVCGPTLNDEPTARSSSESPAPSLGTELAIELAEDFAGHSANAETEVSFGPKLDAGLSEAEFGHFEERLDEASRNVATSVKRAVWERDGASCSFVGAGGRRCGSKHQLEFDHWWAFSLGGRHTVANVRVLCRAHNWFEAERLLGRELMKNIGERAERAHRPKVRGRRERSRSSARGRARPRRG